MEQDSTLRKPHVLERIQKELATPLARLLEMNKIAKSFDPEKPDQLFETFLKAGFSKEEQADWLKFQGYGWNPPPSAPLPY